MFFVCKLSESLTLNPDHFGRNLHASVVSLLTRKVMGKCISPYGMVVSVREVQVPKTARINEDTAEAEFRIRFEAIVLRPIVGEVLDAIVTSVSQIGIHCSVGPATIFVTARALPPDFNSFQREREAWLSEETGDEVRKNSIVRLRLIGLRLSESTMEAMGTMADSEALGLVKV